MKFSFGWQVYEVVRPLVTLLQTDKEGSQNYEALRGLTNLAGYSDKLRWLKEVVVNIKVKMNDGAKVAALAQLWFWTSLCCRVKIVKEKALPEIENHMFEENEKIQLAATECMCNLVTCKEVRTDTTHDAWTH